MMRVIFVTVVAAFILTACSGAVDRTVDKPIDEVRAIVQSSAGSLTYTDNYMPGAGHRTELQPDGMVWRFTLNDRDYARMVISLEPKDPQSTRVSARYEKLGDAAGPGVPFMQETARTLSEEILAAALESRPIDRAALETQFKVQAAKDPLAVGGAAQAYMQEAARMMNEMEAGSSAASSIGPAQPYDRQQPYDKTPAYDRKKN